MARQELAMEPDFQLGPLQVRPSVCRLVHGESEIRMEALTMSVLVALAQAAGNTVTREELVNACWQGRIVSDEAIARTISKVRLLTRGVSPVPFVVEAVPKVGYRLIPGGGEPEVPGEPVESDQDEKPNRWMTAALVASLIVSAFLLGILFSRRQAASPSALRMESAHIYADDVVEAIFTMDEDRIDRYLRSGWKVNWSLDMWGTTALSALPLVCERDQIHDPQRMLRIAKRLVAAGAVTTYKNRFDDTAFIISVSPKYCGRDHVLTEYLRSATPGASADAAARQLGTQK